jgi:regulatory protein
MRITALKTQVKNPERVSIYVDGAYTFSLTINEVLEQKLKKDLEVTQADIEAYKKISSDGKIRARAQEWLMGRPHSAKELKEYLYKKKTDPDLQHKLLQEFQLSGLQSDEAFAQWSVERLLRKGKSKRAVQNELRSKGIERSTIEDVLAMAATSDTAQIAILIEKLRTRSRYADDKKLIAYLISKGFSYDDIKSALTFREPEADA